ncbi:GrpB family protein [Bacillus pseudomycoides]|uniref:GrpB family protein n=1 Tax=Bacillus pseudomycoides TaxID=64104 RepID=UPI003D232BD8
MGDWNELYFRDFLRLHKDVAKEYSNLKMSLIDKYEHDRDGYTEAKTEFVNKYTKIAKTEFENKYIPN